MLAKHAIVMSLNNFKTIFKQYINFVHSVSHGYCTAYNQQ